MGEGLEAAMELGGIKKERTGFVHQRHPEENWQLLPADRGNPPPVPAIDPALLLPPTAQDKLIALRLDFRELNGAAASVADDLRHLHATAIDLRDRAAARASSADQDAGYRRHAEVAMREAAAAETRFLEAQKRAASSQERRNAVGNLLNSVEGFVADLLGMTVAAVDPPTFRKTPTDIPGEIEARRRRLRELQADHRRAELAPLDPRAAKAAMRQQVLTLAAGGCPDIGPLMDGRGGRILFPVPVHPKMGDIDAGVRFSLWLRHDLAVEKLDKLIEEWGDPADSLSQEDRIAKLSELSRDMIAVQHEEEALTVLAEQKGMSIARRADLAPECFLGIRLEGIKT